MRALAPAGMLLAALPAACFVDAPLAGKACDEVHPCVVEGMACVEGRCVYPVARTDAGAPIDGGPTLDGGSPGDAGVPDAGPPALVADAFERVVDGGWGAADVGGSWHAWGDAPLVVGVGSGRGTAVVQAGGEAYLRLSDTWARDVDVRVRVQADKPPTGASGLLFYVHARETPAGVYKAVLQVVPSGAASLAIERIAGGPPVQLGAADLADGIFAPGEDLWMRLAVEEDGPARLSAKVWRSLEPEPAAWQVETTDGAPLANGGTGLGAFLSSSATNAPVTFRFDDFVGVDPR